jgi:dihydrodipicolinate synthase/N-acetylneuraminate lyase
MLLDGLFISLTTPFYADGGSYWRKLEHNVERYSRTPAAGLVALGPWSEGAGLNDEERRETLQGVSASAAAEKVLIAGAAAESVAGSVRMAEWAAEAKFDAVLVPAPLGWQRLVRNRSLVQVEMFFRAVADRAALPVVLWSDAAAGGFALPASMMGELAAHPNVIGVMDAGLTVERFGEIAAATRAVKHETTVTTVFAAVTRRMREAASEGPATFVSAESLSGGASVAVAPPRAAIKTRTKAVGFQVIAAGRAGTMAPLLEAGVAGVMPELATCAPQGCHEVLAAFKDGNPELARLKAARLVAADEDVLALGVAGVKYGCDLNGYFGGVPRLPRVGLTAEERGRVEVALGEVRS